MMIMLSKKEMGKADSAADWAADSAADSAADWAVDSAANWAEYNDVNFKIRETQLNKLKELLIEEKA